MIKISRVVGPGTYSLWFTPYRIAVREISKEPRVSNFMVIHSPGDYIFSGRTFQDIKVTKLE